MAAALDSSKDTSDCTRSIDLTWPFGSSDAHREHAGLVLLYSPAYEGLRPAYVLSDREAVIGRDTATDICVPERSVSRQHARLFRRDGRWVLADLGGRNGTLLNGEFVSEAALHHLDELRVGGAIFKFVESDAESYASYRIDGAHFADPGAGSSSFYLLGAFGRITGGYQIQRIAAGMREVSETEIAVLIRGESGTGKEVFARQLHDWSGRRGPFQAINCAAIPATLIEAELFGHRRGAFSGADRDRPGLIRAAHGGTLFLDEVGDMPLEAQAKLLRVVQSKEILPVGASQAERVDVRVVCATNRDLGELQKSERFRRDLFARINEYSVTLPPLRERKEDIFALCRDLSAQHGRPEVRVTVPFMTGLLHYDFPYNVRELEALIKRWAAVAAGPELGVEHLSDEIKDHMKTYGVRSRAPAAQERSADPAREPAHAPSDVAPSEQWLRGLLADHRGNVAAVGRELGKDRKQVHRWLSRYGIDVSEYR